MVTEKRLIDANAMREDWLENGENEYVYATNNVLDSIDAQPTVDAVEVVHGQWVNAAGCRTICNKCGEYPLYDYFGRLKLSNYCPNCGAKMDGDGNGS